MRGTSKDVQFASTRSASLDAQLPAHGRTSALLAGESVDEVAFPLGHRNANVTRAVYVHELADARRRSMRRSRMVAEYSDLLKP
jgi:integrase